MTHSSWKLTDDRYEFIKSEVAHIFTKFKVRCAPVSSFEIASKMGITIIAYSDLHEKQLAKALRTSSDGFFIEFKGHEYIFYNNLDRPYRRQNWTILHEIGHIVLDHTGHSDYEESEADFFAKFAIASPVIIHNIHSKTPGDIYETFNISYKAAIYAFDYYRKWLHRYQTTGTYTDYEYQLLKHYKEEFEATFEEVV